MLQLPQHRYHEIAAQSIKKGIACGHWMRRNLVRNGDGCFSAFSFFASCADAYVESCTRDPNPFGISIRFFEAWPAVLKQPAMSSEVQEINSEVVDERRIDFGMPQELAQGKSPCHAATCEEKSDPLQKGTVSA
jgi:hypothetical protein